MQFDFGNCIANKLSLVLKIEQFVVVEVFAACLNQITFMKKNVHRIRYNQLQVHTKIKNELFRSQRKNLACTELF